MRTKDHALEQRRRSEIVLATQLLLSEGSHRSVTLSGIAEVLGVSKGMVTYYFPTKDELITAAIEQHFAMQEEALEALAQDTEASPIEKLERVLLVAVPPREEVERGMRFLVEVWSYAKTQPAAMEMIRAAYLSFRGHCQRILEGEREHLASPDLAWTNLVFHALLDGMSFQLAVDPKLDADVIRTKLAALIRQLLAVNAAPADGLDVPTSSSSSR